MLKIDENRLEQTQCTLGQLQAIIIFSFAVLNIYISALLIYLMLNGHNSDANFELSLILTYSDTTEP